MNNQNYKVVLSNHTKANNCKCINCYYGVVDIFKGDTFSKKFEADFQESNFREVISESFSKGRDLN